MWKNNLILVSSVHGAVVFSFILLPQISRVPGAKANWCFGKYRYVRRLLDVISDKLNIELKKIISVSCYRTETFQSIVLEQTFEMLILCLDDLQL